MNLYYYTVASLPALRPKEKSPLTLDRLLEQASEFLTPQDFEILQSVNLIPTDSLVPFLQSWASWERGLRGQLAQLRAQRLGQTWQAPEGSPLFGWEDLARGALQKESPLEAEYFLDDLRWQYLDQSTWNEHFTLNWLMSYSLKLQILLRQDRFERELGKKNLEENYLKITSALAAGKESGELK